MKQTAINHARASKKHLLRKAQVLEALQQHPRARVIRRVRMARVRTHVSCWLTVPGRFAVDFRQDEVDPKALEQLVDEGLLVERDNGRLFLADK